MSSEKFKLGDLLNDDSFIYWVRQDDRLSDSMKKKWDEWLSSDERNKLLLKKARKIIKMPFKVNKVDCDSDELNRLKDAIKESGDNYDV